MGGPRLLFAMATLVVLLADSHVESGAVYRFNRDATFETEDARQTEEERRRACSVYADCLFPESRGRALFTFNRFDFTSTLDEIRSECQNYTGASSCGESPCPRFGVVFHTMYNDMFSWVCDHLDALNSGVECWGDAFQAEIKACTNSNRTPQMTEESVAPLLQCAAESTQSLPGCDADDAAFVTGFINHIAVLTRAMFETET